MGFRRKLISALTLAGIGASVLMPQAASASAKTANWQVSVTYQNVGTASTPVNVSFYPEGSSSVVTFNPLQGIGDGTLAPNAGASFFVGNVSGLGSGFKGSAVVSAEQPLLATAVQFSPDAGFKMRLLSNGFQDTDASDQYLIGTVLLNKFDRTTVFSIQNTESVAIEAEVRLYDADNNGQLAVNPAKKHVIPANSSKYIDMSVATDTGLSAGTTTFNGSAIIVARQQGTSTPAKVVASANEYYINSNVAGSFEGVPLSRASAKAYMATALCQRFGLDTFYGVQNASLTASTWVKVTYRNLDGSVKTVDGPYQIGPGQKKSVSTCGPSSGAAMTNFTGSALVESTTTAGGSTAGAPIVVVGKAQSSIAATDPAVGRDVYTVFLGEPGGYSKVGVPFVRWANNADYTAGSNVGGRQRTFIAVQNLENSAVKVNVKYYDKTGALKATQQLNIAALSKGNSDASTAGALDANGQFGYYTDGTFGGAVTIEADASNASAKFIAIARVQNPGAGEDYNAMPRP